MACADVATAKAKTATPINLIISLLPCLALMNSHRLIMSNALFAARAPLHLEEGLWTERASGPSVQVQPKQSPGPRPIELGTMMAKFQPTLSREAGRDDKTSIQHDCRAL